MTDKFNLYFQTLKVQAPVTAYIVPGQGVARLVFHGENNKPWFSYSAPIEEMPGILRDLLRQAEAIVAGHNPLSEIDDWHADPEPVEGPEVEHFSRKPGSSRLNPGATDWDWLTPEMVMAYVEQSPTLQAVADDVRAVLGKAWPAGGDAVIAPRVPSQLELDLETVRPHLAKIVAGGKINKSEIARVLGLPTGGSGWSRVQAVAGVISSSSTSTDAPPPVISDEKIQSEAA